MTQLATWRDARHGGALQIRSNTGIIKHHFFYLFISLLILIFYVMIFCLMQSLEVAPFIVDLLLLVFTSKQAVYNILHS